MLDDWIAAVSSELGVELDVDTTVLLELARDAAHSVARPAAPLTTFLVGYAAALEGGGEHAVASAARKARALALAWPEEPDGDREPDHRPGRSSDLEPGQGESSRGDGPGQNAT